ncbi:hypothetical protein FIBSPDRAFT_858584 [Athelia psychrophila]|uniref:Uncharacterized protein n=1 Tax=Athelia psychrophila TaxID=1759441 RepID=A0A166LTT1_9AGAM|nr:hypothetical protein FIBSPDRAFT_858584 [Fibularhizoctonia sp. CBS 109695]
MGYGRLWGITGHFVPIGNCGLLWGITGYGLGCVWVITVSTVLAFAYAPILD